MSEKQLYPYNNQMVEGETVSFVTDGEQWNNYTLADGSTLKVKIVMMDIVRLVDQYNENGDPIYLFSAQQVIGVVPNQELKRKA